MTTVVSRSRAAVLRPRRVEPHRRFAIVMAGGVGTRFWPWSREETPKQLLSLTSDRSMLAETVARLTGLVPAENILVVTGQKHLRRVRAELPGLPRSSILGEPVGRNTAACIGWATLEILRRCPEAVTAVLSADHLIGGKQAFKDDLNQAFGVADRLERLVTFGIRPTSPATGYGYVRAGTVLKGERAARKVDAFVEKPNLATAKRYVASGKHFWNSGMFVWRADVIWKEFTVHLPKLATALASMQGVGRRGGVSAAVLARVYPRLESVSIDYGVLEHSDRMAVLPATFSWVDIGSWDAAAGLWPKDAFGNASRDPVLAVDASSNVVATHGKPVVLLGVEGLVVVDAGDALLVCSRDRCQDVKGVVERLRSAGLEKLR